LATQNQNLWVCFAQHSEVSMEAHFVFTQMIKMPGNILWLLDSGLTINLSPFH